MFYKSLLKSMMVFSPLNGFLPILNQQQTQHQPKMTEVTNTLKNIETNYESSNIDIAKINFANLWNDLQKSDFNKNIDNSIDVNWQISRCNDFSNYFISYMSYNHGNQSKTAIEDYIKAKTVESFNYFAMTTLISDIAHYYGDNTKMDQNLRKWAITADILSIAMLNELIQNGLTKLDSDGEFITNLKKWNSNSDSIIQAVVNQDYNSSSLLNKYNDINYDYLLTYHGNLHAMDDYLYDNFIENYHYSPIVLINDWFNLGTSDKENKFKISISNIAWCSLTYDFNDDTEWDVLLMEPLYFNIEIN